MREPRPGHLSRQRAMWRLSSRRIHDEVGRNGRTEWPTIGCIPRAHRNSKFKLPVSADCATCLVRGSSRSPPRECREGGSSRVTRNSPRPLSPDQALLGARADRAVAQCTRPLQHRIDHGTSVAQCRGAWEALAPGYATHDTIYDEPTDVSCARPCT